MIDEIVVGTSRISLPAPWKWKQSNNGSWYAVNRTKDACVAIVSADIKGDEGLQVLVETLYPTYIPAVVIALVVLANDGGTFNRVLPKLTSYVKTTLVVEDEKEQD